MIALLPRRALGAVALAALSGGLGTAGAALATATVPAAVSDEPDAMLLFLAAELRVASRQEEAAHLAYSDAEGTEAEAKARATLDAAFDAWTAIVDRMALVPAVGLAGVCAKAAQLVRASETGGGVADARLAESLRADLVRLAPEVTEA